MYRHHRGTIVVFAAVALVGALMVPATAAPDGGEADRFIVTVDPGDPPSERALRASGASSVQSLEHTPDMVVVVATDRAAQRIATTAGVVAVERDQVLTIQHHRPGHDPCAGPPSQRGSECDDDGNGDDPDPDTGTITGTVTDADGGAALVGATVAVVDTDLSATTDGDGGYTIADVPVGTHDVTASADGYQTATKSVEVTADEATAADFSLEAVEVGDSEQVTPWGIIKIDAPDAWTTTTGTGVAVCVADTGIDPDHEDLEYTKARNFTTNNPHGRNLDPGAYQDGHGHGTHVAGTVAALDNQVGVVGVAPEVDVMVAKVLSDNGSGYTSQIINGLNWCAAEGADVINMSFGGGGTSALESAIEGIADGGVVLVAASGNSSGSSPGCPACYEDVIAVGATNSDDAIASFSNRGEDVNAPGVAVLSTVPGDGYEAWSGTSMASPHAAGVAALIIESGTTDPGDVRAQLIDSADDIDDGIRVNAAAAVK